MLFKHNSCLARIEASYFIQRAIAEKQSNQIYYQTGVKQTVNWKGSMTTIKFFMTASMDSGLKDHVKPNLLEHSNPSRVK